MSVSNDQMIRFLRALRGEKGLSRQIGRELGFTFKQMDDIVNELLILGYIKKVSPIISIPRELRENFGELIEVTTRGQEFIARSRQ